MLTRLLSPYSEATYAALRIVAGLLFAFHGVQKVFGVLTDHQPPFGGQLWIGGVIEPGQDAAGKPRRAVEIEPLGIAFEGDTLNIRA